MTGEAASSVITVPKGGGALRGIGETFTPDLHTGTGNFSVPIAVPAGRNGFQPQLSLTYSTGNGNGLFGLGWALGLPGVARKTSQGIPRYRDQDPDLRKRDVFLLSGAEDLVPVDTIGLRYRPRVEGLFAQIKHRQDGATGSDYWEVRSKDGLTTFYGTNAQDPPDYPHPGSYPDPAVISEPKQSAGSRNQIFAWKITLTKDPFGNRIEYLYETRDKTKDTREARGHSWDQPLLTQIRYVDWNSGASLQFLVTITFVYEPQLNPSSEYRPDPFSDYRAGFEIRTSRRCKAILIETHAGQTRAVRRYEFTYGNDSANSLSLLQAIRVVGFDDHGNPSEELPPLEFRYTQFNPADPKRRRLLPLQGSDLPATSLSNPALELVDLFGCGLPDILELNGTARYWRNRGGGRFDLPHSISEVPAGLHLADVGVQIIDAEGDGRPDLLVTQEAISGYFPLGLAPSDAERRFRRLAKTPSFDLKDLEVRLVDLTGNGITDAVRSGTRLECFFNDQHEGWNEVTVAERRALEVFPNVSFADPRVRWADMSGDGLQDIVLLYNSNVAYWPTLGYGAWGNRLHMRNSPRFPYGYDPKRILLGDVDGDGLTDIIYVDDRRIHLWINRAGNAWSEEIIIHGTPSLSDMDAVRLVDLLGTGIGGILWTRNASIPQRDRWFFLDLTGGTKPYLLSEMHNNLGAVTKVGYAPSTRYYLDDERSPLKHWRTTLPFPVQVVAQVEVIDEISGGKLTTEYSYHHGYWDGAEREFRGFGMVEQRDSESFDLYNNSGLHGTGASFALVEQKYFSAPTLTKAWFHQGPIGVGFGNWHEQDWSDEYWEGDKHLLEHTTSLNAFLGGITNRRIKRDALRALRGNILRTELYATDGSAREDLPYTVVEHAFGLREEEPPFNPKSERPSIFFPFATAQRTTQWERGDDPMTQFSFIGNYDDYGQPQRQTQVACPRGWRGVEDRPSEVYLATRFVTVYAAPIDPAIHIRNRVAVATTYDMTKSAGATIGTLRDRLDDDVDLSIMAQTINYYDGDVFIGLPFGALGAFGAVVRSESLILSEPVLQRAYGGALPGNPWPGGYPQGFVFAAPAMAGYACHPGGPGAVHVRGYFADTDRRRYDFHSDAAGAQGMVEATLDPLGNRTDIEYDTLYSLLPTAVVDAVGLTTRAAYDYRTLRPREVTEPNGSRIRHEYTPLGLLARTWTRGRTGVEGDLQAAGLTLTYDFQAYVTAGQPISVRTIRRVHHDGEIGFPQATRDQTVEVVEYSDAFGRLLQTRQKDADIRFGGTEFGGRVLPVDQSDPATRAAVTGRSATPTHPNVVVSGWQRYDNKGRVVERYEPFFGQGWRYAPPAERELGQKVTTFYDALSRITRIVRPDGSQLRTVHGIPDALDAPDAFTPTPWETYAYDANDLAPLTSDPTAAPAAHHYTPASAEVDALGRTVRVVTRDGTDEHVVRTAYDIRGNVVTVTDALGRTAVSYVHDLADRAVRIDMLDAGTRRIVLDAAGNPIQQNDAKGAVLLRSYDALNRPVRLWARDDAMQTITLRERVVFGDDPQVGLTTTQIAAGNLRGRVYQHFDGAGRLTFAYDFKGNPVEKVRDVVADSAIAGVLATAASGPPRVVVDWDAPPAVEGDYRTSRTYDALNRFTSLRYPRDVDGQRRTLTVTQNEAGALERVALDGESCVDRIAYDAKGQRVLVAYGNGVLTRYAYDPRTFRLARLRAERHTAPAALTYLGDGNALQDFAYRYDLAGNVVAIHDRTPGSGIPGTPLGADALDRVFTYDPLYRLRSATGRECDGTRPPPPPWFDAVRCNDPTRTRAYTQTYDYDAAGNLTLWHHGSTPGAYNRVFALAPGTNRVQQVTDAGVPRTYDYDANGNLVRENVERHFGWDFADRLSGFANRATPTSPPSTQCVYLYGADGERVKRYSRNQQDQVSVTVAIDGVFEHHVSGARGNNTLHVMDNSGRVATVRVGDAFPDDGADDVSVRYQLGDHLRGAHVVVGGGDLKANGLVAREEYTPYGETSFGSFARKRFRFSGKERDEETGLYYHGARYYAPWTGRWVSCDPASLVVEKPTAAPRPPVSAFQYAAANPLAFIDRDGNAARSFYVTLPYELFHDPSGYLKNSGTYAEQLTAQGYEHITAKNVEGLVDQLNGKLESGDTIKELVIATHGTPQGSFLLPSKDATNQSADTLKAAARRLGPALADLQKRMAGAKITMHACEVGNAKDAMKDIGRFFGAKGGEVVAPKPFVNFFRRNADGTIILLLDKDMDKGGEWSINSKEGEEAMTRVRITDDPMSTTPEANPAGAARNGNVNGVNLRRTESPDLTFEGYNPDTLGNPRGNRDAGR
jgi:RHS repeat-associated protein